ncbi:MAG: Hydantoinase/oxoprolinase [Acidimicrobiaceae bacterium]|nr:MAG: Hydantoinase/oxoprolinase [Acidimicrobiaceae bacterium]
MSTSQPSERTLLMGIDTGGTYTDAVVYDERHRRVVAKAKASTTHHDLHLGIRDAIAAALARAAVDPADIELVALSTTLATNALVEGKGRPVCAVIIGFDDDVVERGGLAEALAGDPAIFLRGGHDSHGSEIEPLDLDGLERRLGEMLADARLVDGFAVMSQFSVRNPAHELAAAEMIRDVTRLPVTCSHALSAQLNGPRRAVTAVLNARLVPIVAGLVATTQRTIADTGISAPLMVVRGDGSLVSAAFVRDRPIETILSGPAASLVGAAHLTGLADAIISDIGGTTTDVAVLRSGAPIVSPLGATVGGHQTMVAAVDMVTHGLGGDSEVRHDDRAMGASLLIGPRRVVPVGLLAVDEPELVHAALDRQLRSELVGDLDGVFLVADDRRSSADRLAPAERRILDAFDGRVGVATTVLDTLVSRRIAERLVQRGVLQYAAFTPSDANHVIGRQRTFDSAASAKAADLFARRRDRMGRPIAADGAALAALTIERLIRRSAEAALSVAFSRDGFADDAVRSQIVQRSLDRSLTTVQVDIAMASPLVGLGAAAASYYPAVAALLRTDVVIPDDADVANAIGAVVGRVRIAHTCAITSPQPGQFVVHSGKPSSHVTLDEALAAARCQLEAAVHTDMVTAGASTHETSAEWTDVTVDVGGSPLFVEGTLVVTGSGRPELSR